MYSRFAEQTGGSTDVINFVFTSREYEVPLKKTTQPTYVSSLCKNKVSSFVIWFRTWLGQKPRNGLSTTNARRCNTGSIFVANDYHVYVSSNAKDSDKWKYWSSYIFPLLTVAQRRISSLAIPIYACVNNFYPLQWKSRELAPSGHAPRSSMPRSREAEFLLIRQQLTLNLYIALGLYLFEHSSMFTWRLHNCIIQAVSR